MKAKDLRPYNIVGVKGDAGTYQVVAVDGYDQTVKLNYPRDNWHPESKLKGTLITPEWLDKTGFEERGDLFVFFTPFGKGFVYKGGYIVFCGVTIEVNVQFVHQLQNLYHSLTGQELTINDN